VQVVCDPDRSETFARAETLRNEFCIAVTGRVRGRPEGTVNPSLMSGEIEVLAHELTVLNASLTPPFQLDDENLSETVRLTHRVIDLRRPEMQSNLKLRHRAAMAARRFLDEHGFIDIETPFLYKSTPEGAREFLVPSRIHHGQFYALPQSPQLFKQMLMIAGFDRYYQVVKCFRDEDLRADRQPEFTQIDIETSFLTELEIRAMMEALVRAMWKGLFRKMDDSSFAIPNHEIEWPIFRKSTFHIARNFRRHAGRVGSQSIGGWRSIARSERSSRTTQWTDQCGHVLVQFLVHPAKFAGPLQFKSGIAEAKQH